MLELLDPVLGMYQRLALAVLMKFGRSKINSNDNSNN